MTCRDCATGVAFDERRITIFGGFICGDCKLELQAALRR